MPEGEVSAEPREPVRKVKSFTTAHGSVYTYNEEGKTSRYKTITGEQHEVMDITVFADLTDDQQLRVLQALHSKDRGEKVYVLERQKDDGAKKIRDIQEVTDPESLYIGVVRDNNVVFKREATMKPTIGFYVFDSRNFDQDGKSSYERHLGNQVLAIEYEN